MTTESIGKRRLTAVAATVAAATFPALALGSSPTAAAADCEKWGFISEAFIWGQGDERTGWVYFPRPAAEDPPVFSSFNGANAEHRFDRGLYHGRGNGRITGDDITITVVWDDDAKGRYSGKIDQKKRPGTRRIGDQQRKQDHLGRLRKPGAVPRSATATAAPRATTASAPKSAAGRRHFPDASRGKTPERGRPRSWRSSQRQKHPRGRYHLQV